MKPIKHCRVCEGPINNQNRGHSEYCSKKCEGVVHGYGESYTRKLSREKLRSLIEAGTAWAPPAVEHPKHLVTGYPVLVVNDVHCPMQDAAWTEQALVTAEKFGCRTCVINGDLIDAHQISKYMGTEFRGTGTLEDDINAAEKFISLFCDLFDEVYYTLGNHTNRILSRMGGELSIQRLFKMISDNPKLKVSSKTWMIVNENIRCLHPRAYSQIRGKLTADLALLYQCHLITGHHHHTATTVSKDGKWQVVEVGCLANTKLMSYVQNHMNNMPTMANGFAIIMPTGEILNFNEFTHWGTFGLPKLGAK